MNGKNYMKMYKKSLVIREVQLKNTMSYCYLPIKMAQIKGIWVAQLVGQPTPGFGPGHDLRVLGSNPYGALHSSGTLLEDSLSPFAPCPSCAPVGSLSLK